MIVSAGIKVGIQWLLSRGLFQGNEDIGPAALKAALGTLKGPMMKIAQILGNIPGALPDNYREAFAELQSMAPPMGPLFVKRRMRQELGENYNSLFCNFELDAFKAASLGQVHKAELKSGEKVVCKLQYPAMKETVASDLQQFVFVLNSLSFTGRSIEARGLIDELADRLYEEIDYRKEVSNLELFRAIYASQDFQAHIKAPCIPKVFTDYSTDKLIVMEYLAGEPLVAACHNQDMANNVGRSLFWCWYWPLYYAGVIHGDSHMGNYALGSDGTLQLYDFGCVKVFSQEFVKSIEYLYRGLLHNDKDQYVHAFEKWGFVPLHNSVIECLHKWALYMYGPLLEDKVRPIDEDFSSEKGRLLAREVFRQLKKAGGVTPPKEFVFLDRATVGMGGTLMNLKSVNNWHKEFEALLEYARPYLINERQRTYGISC